MNAVKIESVHLVWETLESLTGSTLFSQTCCVLHQYRLWWLSSQTSNVDTGLTQLAGICVFLMLSASAHFLCSLIVYLTSAKPPGFNFTIHSLITSKRSSQKSLTLCLLFSSKQQFKLATVQTSKCESKQFRLRPLCHLPGSFQCHFKPLLLQRQCKTAHSEHSAVRKWSK